MPHVKLPAENQNLKLYYELHGQGENKILFVMGLLTEGAAWIRQVRIFFIITMIIILDLISRQNSSQKSLTIRYG